MGRPARRGGGQVLLLLGVRVLELSVGGHQGHRPVGEVDGCIATINPGFMLSCSEPSWFYRLRSFRTVRPLLFAAPCSEATWLRPGLPCGTVRPGRCSQLLSAVQSTTLPLFLSRHRHLDDASLVGKLSRPGFSPHLTVSLKALPAILMPQLLLGDTKRCPQQNVTNADSSAGKPYLRF